MKKIPKSGIYAIKNKVNGKAYVGSAVDLKRRRIDHTKRLKAGHHENNKLQRAWLKYGEEAFDFTVIEALEDLSKLIEREQAWIDKMKAAGRNSGYNIRPIAGSSLGVRPSIKSRKKMSESSKGQIAWNKGKVGIYSEESLQNMRKNHKSPSIKITPVQVLEIRKITKQDGYNRHSVGLKYGLAPHTIDQIRSGRLWPNVGGLPCLQT